MRTVSGAFRFRDDGGVFDPRTGGVAGVNAQDEGVAVPNTPHTIIDFVGPGVTATDKGGGKVEVAVPGVSPGDIVAALGVRPTNLYPATMEAEPGAKVVVNDYPALEISPSVTRYGWGSLYWTGDPPANINCNIKFVLASAGTGTDIRLALRIKSRGTGEVVTGADDFADFVAVAITHTTDGEIFEGQIVVPGAVFADGDAVAVALGRDGNNELGAGTNDDVNKAIRIIAAELEVVPA